MIQIEDMTHEELASYGRKLGARHNNDTLLGLAIDLQEAVDEERESEALARRVIEAIENSEVLAKVEGGAA